MVSLQILQHAGADKAGGGVGGIGSIGDNTGTVGGVSGGGGGGCGAAGAAAGYGINALVTSGSGNEVLVFAQGQVASITFNQRWVEWSRVAGSMNGAYAFMGERMKLSDAC